MPREGDADDASAACRRRTVAAGRARLCPDLACQAGPHRRALPGRRLGRHPVPPGRREALRRLGPDGDHRQPRRRGRQCRRRGRLSRRARRLHPAVQPARPAVDQPQPLQDAALRLVEVFSHRRAGAGAQRHHRAPRPAAGLAEGLHRLRQGQSRQGDLRLARQRLDLAPVGQHARHPGRHRAGARALQGRGPGPGRPHRQPRRHLHRQHLGRAALREGQAGAVPGAGQPHAQPGRAGRADHRRARLPGPGVERLVRPGGAARHARRRRAEGECRPGRGAQPSPSCAPGSSSWAPSRKAARRPPPPPSSRTRKRAGAASSSRPM